MLSTRFLLLLVLSSVSLLQGCQVTLNGQDVTNDLFISVEDESFVNCAGKRQCEEAVIVDCPVVKCSNIEACFKAQIINFTHSVLCEGSHSCHYTELIAAADVPNPQTVRCNGKGACDVAHIIGDVDEVSCDGAQSCRKARVEGSKLVKCRQGTEQNPACSESATFETSCLYCGKDGCAGYINMCRYKIIGSDDDTFAPCFQNYVEGNSCPVGIQHLLNLELAGKVITDAEWKL
jgi:hypothetical protein